MVSSGWLELVSEPVFLFKNNEIYYFWAKKIDPGNKKHFLGQQLNEVIEKRKNSQKR